MANERTSYTQEETISLVSQRVAAGVDSFIVKIYRRRGMAGLTDHIATFGDGKLGHISNPETWIPKLAGGGQFMMQVFEASNSNLIGGWLQFNYSSPPIQVDPRVVRSSNWQGPPLMIFPEPEESRDVTPPPVSMPGIPGAPHLRDPQIVPTGAPSGSFSAELREIEARLAMRERELQQRDQRAREDLAKEEARLERERFKNEMDLKMKALEGRPPAGKGIAEILAALAPLAMTFLQSQAAARDTALKMQMDQAAQTQQMLVALLGKPAPGISPEMQAVLDMMKVQLAAKGNDSTGMAQMIDAMGMVSKQSISMLETVAEMNLGGQPENPMLLAIKEIASGLASMGSGAAAAAHARIQQPPQLQQGHPQQAFAGHQQQRGPQHPVDRLERMLRSHLDPAIFIDQFFKALPTQELQAELEAAQGDIVQLFLKRLGTWIQTPENQAYIKDLVPRLHAEAVRRGVIQDEPAPIVNNGQAAQVQGAELEEDDEEDMEEAQA